MCCLLSFGVTWTMITLVAPGNLRAISDDDVAKGGLKHNKGVVRGSGRGGGGGRVSEFSWNILSGEGVFLGGIF